MKTRMSICRPLEKNGDLKMYKKIALSILALLICVCGNPRLQAAEAQKPIAVISFSGYDRTWNAIQQIADQMGFGPIVQSFRQTSAEIKGMDKNKPFGFALFNDGKDLIPFAFLPIKNLDQLEVLGIESIKKDLKKEGGKYSYTTPKNVTLELFEKGDWLYIYEKSKAASIPSTDPSTFLKNKDKDIFLQGSLFIENIPKDLLEVLFAPLREQIAKANPTSEKQLERLSQYFNTLTDTLKTLSFFTKIDSKTGKGINEFVLTAKEGSSLLKSWEASSKAKTKWNPLFRPKNAVLSFLQIQAQIGDDKKYLIDSQSIMFDSFIQEIDKQIEGKDDQAKAREIVNNLKKIYIGPLKKDSCSFAGTLTSEPMIFLGADITEGDLLKKTLQQITDYFAIEYPDFVKQYVKIDAGRMNDWSVSTLTLPLELLDTTLPEWAQKLKISFLIGIQKEAAVLFVGTDQKKLTNAFKDFASKPFKEEATPETICVFSAKELGKLLDLPGSPKEFAPQFFKIRDILKAAPENAICTISTQFEGDTFRQTRVCDGSIYKILGQITRVFTNPNQSEHKDDLQEGENLFDDPAPTKKSK